MIEFNITNPVFTFATTSEADAFEKYCEYHHIGIQSREGKELWLEHQFSTTMIAKITEDFNKWCFEDFHEDILKNGIH